MSFINRLGNLGKGLIHTTLNPSTQPTAVPGSDEQGALAQAFAEGRLTLEEYRARLMALSAQLAGKSTPPAPVSDPTPKTNTSASAAESPEDAGWDDPTPVKRTL